MRTRCNGGERHHGSLSQELVSSSSTFFSPNICFALKMHTIYDSTIPMLRFHKNNNKNISITALLFLNRIGQMRLLRTLGLVVLLTAALLNPALLPYTPVCSPCGLFSTVRRRFPTSS